MLHATGQDGYSGSKLKLASRMPRDQSSVDVSLCQPLSFGDFSDTMIELQRKRDETSLGDEKGRKSSTYGAESTTVRSVRKFNYDDG